MSIGCAVCQDVTIENNTIVHQNSFYAVTIRVPDRTEKNPQSNNVTVRNNTILYDSPSKGGSIKLGDGDGSLYTSEGNSVYKSTRSHLAACGEMYNNGDKINVSGNVCHEGIPQELLDATLAKTKPAFPQF